MSYTIKNLRDVENQAAKFGYGDTQEARFPWRDLDAEQTGLGLIHLKPGKRMPFAHRHQEAEEIYVVLAGSGRIKLDDGVQEIGPLDAIRIAPGVRRGLEAGPEGLEYLAFGPHREGDAEIIQEQFWD